jgi:hypothetical protein
MDSTLIAGIKAVQRPDGSWELDPSLPEEVRIIIGSQTYQKK